VLSLASLWQVVQEAVEQGETESVERPETRWELAALGARVQLEDVVRQRERRQCRWETQT